jgi:hypothetical protein
MVRVTRLEEWMADESPDASLRDRARVAAEDAQVFDLLAQAEKQYDEYLKISQSASVADIWADSLTLPPVDVPLSLTIWPDR